ncbi:MAG: response regulator [Treponema sp.]|nr:response regulator [Treponema sp.]
MKKEVAFICDNARNFLVRSMLDELKEAEWTAEIYSTSMSNYDFTKTSYKLFIIYIDDFNKDTEKMLSSMQKMVMNDKSNTKQLYIVGTEEDIKQAYKFIDLTLVAHAFKRPVNVDSIIRELNINITNPASDIDSKSIESIKAKLRNENKKTIMIVDDDDIYLRTIENWFISDYNVYTTASATSALSMVKSIPFDLILLDYEMPVLSGLDFLRIIRSEEKTKNIPVIFLTAKDDKNVVLEILKDKPTGYLLKTTAPITLKYNIKQFFEGKPIWWKSEDEV